MIEINNISKSYDSVKALSNVSINVEKGKLFGLIGPDGAGKSTLFRILTTLILPDEGNAKLMDFDTVKDYKQIRNKIGYMPGKFSLYMDLSVQENLKFFANVFSTTIDANYEMIEDIYVMLEPFKNRKAGDLSGGMKQKLALCCALIHKPELLLLDEPTFGVDPVSRKEFWENLKKLQKNDGLTTIVSTPYMDEASLCDEVALIQDGKIMAVDTPENISNKFSKTLYEIKSSNNYKTLTLIRNFEEINTAYMFGNSIHVTLKNDNKPEELKQLINIENIEYSIEEIKPNIEDSFMELMAKEQ
ncbi:MAG: ABC transporter ATP-binding protein [Bacteroidota bacterium]